MFKIARLELRGKSRGSTLIVFSLIATAILTYYILKFGVNLDRGIYTINVPIGFKSFDVSPNPDLTVNGDVVILRGNLKSYSAFDEFRNYIRSEYNRYLNEKYGDYAFPVLIRLHKVSTGMVVKVEREEVPKEKPKKERKKAVENVSVVDVGEVGKVGKVGKVEKVEKEGKVSLGEFYLPENLRPPILLEKFAYAFILILPFYFLAQAFTSSFMEDKVARRFDVLLSVVSEGRFLIEKMTPYLTVGLAISILIALIFKSVIMIPLLMVIMVAILSIDSFLVFISRSYKELSFITVVVTLVVTTYLFIPAVFSFIPMSEISPVTLIVRSIGGEFVGLNEILISIVHLSIISITLLYVTSNSFEFMYSHGLITKLIEVTTKLTDSYLKVFLFVTVSIPLVFLIEFFMLSVTFPFKSYALILIVLAFVEEFFKCLFIYSASLKGLNPYLSAFLSAFGFFLGEKFILLSVIPIEMFGLLTIPLLAHILSALVFTLTMRFGFKFGLLSASSVHSIYNGLILCMLLR
ncbi:MAG: hypothetical protein DRP01_04015 [Archaeoglobales archaeon]|nr:MAG: hypothetical protein DRP01_04015 [Archaeoglobales archaeon]